MVMMGIGPVTLGVMPSYASADVVTMAIMALVPVTAMSMIAIFFTPMMIRANIIGDVRGLRADRRLDLRKLQQGQFLTFSSLGGRYKTRAH